MPINPLQYVWKEVVKWTVFDLLEVDGEKEIRLIGQLRRMPEGVKFSFELFHRNLSIDIGNKEDASATRHMEIAKEMFSAWLLSMSLEIERMCRAVELSSVCRPGQIPDKGSSG